MRHGSPTSRIRRLALSTLTAALLPSGCTTFRPVVVASKTALETEILGHFERVNTELMLAPPLRDGRLLSLTDPQRALRRAAVDRALGATTIKTLKRQQFIGEARNGMLAILQQPPDPAAAERVERAVRFENEARLRAMQAVIASSPKLARGDLPAVRDAFHRIELQAAESGERLEGDDGRWYTATAPQERKPHR